MAQHCIDIQRKGQGLWNSCNDTENDIHSNTIHAMAQCNVGEKEVHYQEYELPQNTAQTMAQDYVQSAVRESNKVENHTLALPCRQPEEYIENCISSVAASCQE